MLTSSRTVSDVMTRTVVALRRDAHFKDIAKTMRQRKVSALPVLEGDGRVVGVVSEADLLPKEEFRHSEPTTYDRVRRLSDIARAEAVTAEELMSAPAVCVPAGTTLSQAARIMAQRRIKRLPVTDAEGKLCGIVSRRDLLTVFLRTDMEIAEEVRREVVGVLFPSEPSVTVDVHDGVVNLRGRILGPGLSRVATRLARAVAGVVDVRCEPTGTESVTGRKSAASARGTS